MKNTLVHAMCGLQATNAQGLGTRRDCLGSKRSTRMYARIPCYL